MHSRNTLVSLAGDCDADFGGTNLSLDLRLGSTGLADLAFLSGRFTFLTVALVVTSST